MTRSSMSRFLHTSDWQLGMTRHFLLPEAQARFTQDRIDAIRKIGALATEHSAQFVVVAGDVFESNQVAPQTVARALEALRTIPVPVFLLPANHDPLDAASVYRCRTFVDKRPDNVIVVETAEPLAVPGSEDVEVVGLPWHSKRQLADMVAQATAGLEPAPIGTVRVMLAHGIVDALSPDPDAADLIALAPAEAAVRDGRIHYLALGDRHSTTDVGTTGSIWYSGAHVATSFRDAEPGNVLLVQIADDRSVSVERLPVDRSAEWRFVDHAFDLAGLEDVNTLEAFLDSQSDKAHTIVRLALTGQLSISATARLDEILDDLSDHFASLRQWERSTDLAILRDEMDATELDLAGYARSTWEQLASDAEAAEEPGRQAADALALLYRLARSAGADQRATS
jgi:DNA repair exonuclease SbcCD nuclease subunit